MKICLINNLYPPYQKGGAENITSNVSKGLKKLGHDVFIITSKPAFSFKKNPSLEKIYYIRSLYFYLKKIPKILRIFWHIIDAFDISSYLKIKKILKQERPRLVITHNLKGLGYLIPAALRQLKIKHFHTLHDIQLIHPSGLMIYGQEQKINGFWAKIYSKISVALFNSPDAVISPSQWLLNLHLERGFFPKSKKIILPNPGPQLSHPQRFKEKNKFFSFLYAGQIEKHKGVEVLINAFLKLTSGFPEPCRLIIAGGGSRLKELKKKYRRYKNIIFLGKKENSEILKLIQKADALIVPSICYENSPTVIYEAALAGTPIAASRIGGITELVQKLGGTLFEPNNENNLMLQMKWLLEKNQASSGAFRKRKLKIKAIYLNNYLNKLLNI